MRSGVGVLSDPAIDYDLRLLRGREPLGIQDRPAQCAVEPLVVAVLPGAAR